MADGKVRIPCELLASVPTALAHQPQTAGQCLGAARSRQVLKARASNRTLEGPGRGVSL